MEFRFATDELRELYQEEKGARKYPSDVVDAFFSRMAVIANAVDERDMRALTMLHLEKLKSRSNGYSIRLTKKGGWRLIFSFDPPSGAGKVLVVEEISKHYGD